MFRRTSPTDWESGGVGPGAVVCLLVVAVAGCSLIDFEKSPYVIRDLEVVYSQQEDITFFVWRLREDAVLDRVEFELYRGGEYRRIDLDETPYPASPYECGDERICFQYQVRGRYDAPAAARPMRSRHVEQGTFAGPSSGLQNVEETFGADPVAVDQNEVIAPRRFDWFESEGVPLKREFAWQFVPHREDTCREGGDDWATFEGRVEVDYGWVEESQCFAMRPVMEGGEAPRVATLLPPSAETYVDEQTYEPEKLEPPIVYGVVFDLSIASETRCQQVKGSLLSNLRTEIQARGEHREIGVYTPRARTGESLDGCDQEPNRRLPISQIRQDAVRVAQNVSPPDVRVMLIYANNIEIEPQDQIEGQLQTWMQGLGPGIDLALFNWAIASNTIVRTANWNYTTGWRPVEDDTLVGDIRSVAENYLPFATMDHEDDREISVEPIEEVESPEAFKICQSTPVPIEGLGVESGSAPYGNEDGYVPWPETGKPFYRVSLPPQYLVAKSEYLERSVEVVVEVCDRYCDHRFLSQGGELYDNWRETPGSRPLRVCQWRD